MTKYRITGAAALAALALTVAACGNGDGETNGTDGTTGAEPPAGDQSLSILSSWEAGGAEATILAEVAAAFEEETGATVTISEAGEDVTDVHETSVLGGTESDIIIVNLYGNPLNWLTNGAAVPVNDYLVEWGLEGSILPTAQEAWTDADGNLQGFSYEGFSWPVWFNTDLLADVGISEVPQSTDDLIAAADALNEAGLSGVVVGGSDWSGQKLFTQILQSYLPAEEAATVFAEGGYCASDNALKGIEHFIELRDAGVFVTDVAGYTSETMNSTFFASEAAIMSAGSWSYSSAPDDIVSAVTLGGFPIPDDGVYDNPTAMEGYTSAGFWVSPAGAENSDLVGQFISKFYEAEVVERFVQEAAWVPAAVVDTELEITHPLLSQAANNLVDLTDIVLLPDNYVPADLATDMERQTALAYDTGQDSAAICAALDSIYP